MHRSCGSSAANGLNPRSCVTCRRRKVKCNKEFPCSNCVRQHIDCVFPAPGRAPRKPKKPDSELLDRLRRLEGVVRNLGALPGEDDAALLRQIAGLNKQVEGSGGVNNAEHVPMPSLPPPLPAPAGILETSTSCGTMPSSSSFDRWFSSNRRCLSPSCSN